MIGTLRRCFWGAQSDSISRVPRKDKCSVFLNHVNTRMFQPKERAKSNGKHVIIFPGGLQWHQGLDIAIRAFNKLRNQLPKAEFHIYGEGSMKPDLMRSWMSWG